MFKTVALAALMAASCAASAATNTWTFTYTGFTDDNSHEFLPGRTLSGTFTGSDINVDGFVDKSEISSLLIGGMDYVTCGAASGEYFKCGADSFSYHIGGGLDFVAGVSSRDPEGYISGGHFYHTGLREWDFQSTPSEITGNSYSWNDGTRLTVEIAAVPEPGTWAMLAAGLLVVSGASLRRRRRRN
jgi:hypothetical protein